MRVLNEETILISLEKCFCIVFCEFFEVNFDCTCVLADQSLYAGIVAYASIIVSASWHHFFLVFLCCTIYYGLVIALGLHRNSINGMHIIDDFLLHLIIGSIYIYREQHLVHSPLTPANPQGLYFIYFSWNKWSNCWNKLFC
jgi:hypothetical protein